jgi:uncharacterized protein YdbL (DUF1318 family)
MTAPWIRLRAVFLVAFAALGLSLWVATADAQSLDSLRASGVVGERYDGYLVLRESDAPASARATVEQVNEKRRQIYAERAAQQGVPADQVGRVYARQIFQEAPTGTWFLDESGKWVQK